MLNVKNFFLKKRWGIEVTHEYLSLFKYNFLNKLISSVQLYFLEFQLQLIFDCCIPTVSSYIEFFAIDRGFVLENACIASSKWFRPTYRQYCNCNGTIQKHIVYV